MKYLALVIILLILVIVLSLYTYGEQFSPYASILANQTFRSDPAFDANHSKIDEPPSGNYLDLFVQR